MCKHQRRFLSVNLEDAFFYCDKCNCIISMKHRILPELVLEIMEAWVKLQNKKFIKGHSL